ncbi:hypothetical protein [Blastomonas sp. AAP25]|uniref:hypothetical protein n=1 Tax=Blastomonas sp. AAP25 TaxID=1523416 RepID=UPI0012E1970B|nr:hypothetical protein [Blastomonas sp. AAP25]
MLDNGAFSEWQAAMKRGDEWFVRDDWSPYYRWLEPRLHGNRWAIIPDAPGAPSQLNDALLTDWPFGPERAAPVWHMDAPVERLLRLCDRFPRVCMAWTGMGADKAVGCQAWFERMFEIAPRLEGRWQQIHHLRGVLIAREFPFASADASSGAQNGWRYDTAFDFGDRWRGRADYLARLEQGSFPRAVRNRLQANRAAAERRCSAPGARYAGYEPAVQLGLW